MYIVGNHQFVINIIHHVGKTSVKNLWDMLHVIHLDFGKRDILHVIHFGKGNVLYACLHSAHDLATLCTHHDHAATGQTSVIVKIPARYVLYNSSWRSW